MHKIKYIIGIVVFALVILALIPYYIVDGEVSRSDRARLDMEVLSESLELFKNANGYYPSTEQGLKYLFAPPGEEKQILLRLPKDPWNNEYHYVYPGKINKNSYDIVSYAADNMEGGVGENKDIIN